jgi:BirA family biotin operon repressor/biotin-[acetyl-CoA-carboxylase] ligase
VAGSTNDEAAARRDAGASPRTAVVADRQTAGRGRGGRSFASPAGGLYVSLLVRAEPRDLPGPLTAAVSLAAAEAVEDAAGVRASVKWPNDVWVGGRKAGGILLESSGGRPVAVAGIGVNVRSVPEDLPPDVRRLLTSIAAEAGRPIARGTLLERLLVRVDQRVDDLGSPEGRARVASAWRDRLVLRGERIAYVHAGRPRTGVLLDASLDEGLRVLDDEEGPVLRRPEHVQDLRPVPP